MSPQRALFDLSWETWFRWTFSCSNWNMIRVLKSSQQKLRTRKHASLMFDGWLQWQDRLKWRRSWRHFLPTDFSDVFLRETALRSNRLCLALMLFDEMSSEVDEVSCKEVADLASDDFSTCQFAFCLLDECRQLSKICHLAETLAYTSILAVVCYSHILAIRIKSGWLQLWLVI